MSRPIPQAVESERALLGAILLRGRYALDLAGRLAPELFYDPRHREIFVAVILADSKGAIDAVSVFDALQAKQRAVGGIGFLSDLLGSVFTADNVGVYADSVRRTWMLRRLIIVASELATLDRHDPADVLVAARERYAELAEEWERWR